MGETVECWWRSNPDGPGCWLRGVVVGHWWRNENWPDGQAAPYQVRLDDGTLIFAPRDDDSCVREAAPDLDLDPDAPEPPELPSGSAARPHGPPPPPPPPPPRRQAKTKDGKTYANVSSVLRLPKGMQSPPIDPSFTRYKDRKEEEGQPDYPPEDEPPPPGDDDIPF